MNIGPIQLAMPFVQAGLAGYSDRAMRLVARRRGCPYAVTEALLDTIMLNGGEGLRRSIDINEEDHPIAGQLIGSDPTQMAQAAVILADAGYDVVDVNLACPVKKIRNKARGGHLLSDPQTAMDILKAVRDAVSPRTPVTLKLRRAYDDSAEADDAFYRIFDLAVEYRYAAVAVHARTVEQKYGGAAHWPFLAALKQRYPQQVILGSGDVFDAASAVRMYRETGVDAVWIARGAIGNPWIFADAAKLLAGADPASLPSPSVHVQREALLEHFVEAMKVHGEQLAGRRMRKTGIRYARFHPQADEVKKAFIQVLSLRDWKAVLERWYAVDAPGVVPAMQTVDLVNECAT
jgi:nifR3 family TIM-barrel protein